MINYIILRVFSLFYSYVTSLNTWPAEGSSPLTERTGTGSYYGAARCSSVTGILISKSIRRRRWWWRGGTGLFNTPASIRLHGPNAPPLVTRATAVDLSLIHLPDMKRHVEHQWRGNSRKHQARGLLWFINYGNGIIRISSSVLRPLRRSAWVARLVSCSGHLRGSKNKNKKTKQMMRI